MSFSTSSSTKSLDRWCRSLLVLPSNTDEIQPHHVVVLSYGLFTIISTLSIYKNYIKPFWNEVSRRSLCQLSDLSEKIGLPLVHAGFVPDVLIRWGIRLQLRAHLAQLSSEPCVEELETKMNIVNELQCMPIAIDTDTANEQHYEVPAKFYDLCLGPKKKYSSGLWNTPSTTFEDSETAMLQLYCERAQVKDGMNIVDLGCGWGSLSLYLIEQYPNCKITGISNSSSQSEYILKTAKERNLNVNNINIITCNVADDKDGALNVVKNNDLVMTIEMFEHMKNYSDLLNKIHKFLKPSGKLFVHIFTHKDYCYHFDGGWMSDNFFTGGTMPSDDLLLYFAKDFAVDKHWRVNGTNYEKTSNGWLNYLDTNWKNGSLQPVLVDAYGAGKEREWYVNWRLFFLACAELWGYENGEEWIVSHYLFQRRG